jgi:uncharacterized membrane protein
MSDNAEKIDELFAKLESLLNRQEYFYREINDLKLEISRLRNAAEKSPAAEPGKTPAEQQKAESNPSTPHANQQPNPQAPTAKAPPMLKKGPIYKPSFSLKLKSGIENFIGENLINKIGIAITVLGVAIGAKYSIEHELISPLTRIILGYLMGLILLGFGIKLKTAYENFSAVLVSGAIAILYFITYAAYSFYSLFPQLPAFLLMVVFTGFAVVAAIKYDKQVIAHIGLVGAYAVPFLLSEGSGKVAIMFTYMAIINIGILLIALKKYWKPLYYSSFFCTWLIFGAWYFTKYKQAEHFTLAFSFLAIFFIIFYILILTYKLIHKDRFLSGEIYLLLLNAFLFYGIGYSMINGGKNGDQLLGLFTLANAFIHFIVSAFIYRQKLVDRNLVYLVAGLVIVFITIAIPVQLDGNWVTLLWAGEAALLFWIGRSRQVPVYEKLSYPLMYLAFFSIVHDWQHLIIDYSPDKSGQRNTPVFNTNFLNAFVFTVFFSFITYLNNSKRYPPPEFKSTFFKEVIDYSIPAMLLIVMYAAFRNEIAVYWDQLYADYTQLVQPEPGKDFRYVYSQEYIYFKKIWIINYSMLFLSILAFVNIRYLRNRALALINMLLLVLALAVFLTDGLVVLQSLKDSYYNQNQATINISSSFNMTIRYICYAAVSLALFAFYRYTRQDFIKPVSVNLAVLFDIILFTSILWIASTEMITWMDIQKYSASNKLALSILWGIYALLLIMLGIWKKKKHLRIGAITLFAATLIKLFFYDISALATISKTIVFVSLGVLLLIISFLYNKYKHLISEENDT